MPSDEEVRTFELASQTPENAKVNQLLQPSLLAYLRLKNTDRWVRRHLSNCYADVELQADNGADVTHHFTKDSVLEVPGSKSDPHNGDIVTVEFKFDTLKIGTPGSYKFHVRLHAGSGKDSDSPEATATSSTFAVFSY